jgi:hypothetical protein
MSTGRPAAVEIAKGSPSIPYRDAIGSARYIASPLKSPNT